MSKELDTCREFSKAQIAELESLREQNLAQAAQIEKYKNTVLVLEDFAGTVGGSSSFWTDYYPQFSPDNFPTDSKQILQEWLDKILGEPVAYQCYSGTLCYRKESISPSQRTMPITPLFKKPEIKNEPRKDYCAC